MLLVKIAKYVDFCVYHRSRLIWSPVVDAHEITAGGIGNLPVLAITSAAHPFEDCSPGLGTNY